MAQLIPRHYSVFLIPGSCGGGAVSTFRSGSSAIFCRRIVIPNSSATAASPIRNPFWNFPIHHRTLSSRTATIASSSSSSSSLIRSASRPSTASDRAGYKGKVVATVEAVSLFSIFKSSSSSSSSSSNDQNNNTSSMSEFSVQKSDDEWRAVLSREQFRILRQKGTEIAGTGEYEHHKEKGTYNCAGCGAPLYTSSHKFSSGCGWPAFFDAIPGAIQRNEDKSYGLARTEIVCAKCGGHLGHVFKGEGYNNPIDERHCVNSVSLKFEDEKKEKDAK